MLKNLLVSSTSIRVVNMEWLAGAKNAAWLMQSSVTNQQSIEHTKKSTRKNIDKDQRPKNALKSLDKQKKGDCQTDVLHLNNFTT